MTSSPPLLSVVTITKNNFEGLKRTHSSLRHILGAEHGVEWVVWDGGSRDGSVDYLSRVKPNNWRSCPDKGIYDAMNHGNDLAAGKFVVFINSGDELVMPSVAWLRDSRNYDCMIAGAHEIVFVNGRSAARGARPWEYLQHGLPTSHQAIIYPRDWVSHHRYRTSFLVAGDYDLTCRLIQSGIGCRRERTVIARFYRGGTSSHHIATLNKEASLVQRTVLKRSHLAIAKSSARRLAATYAAQVLDIRLLHRATSEGIIE
jgi:putative colanic acid biosynthesis glycosyltransferase